MNCLNSKEHPLFFSPTLAKTLGIEASIFLEKLHYWLMHPSQDIGVFHEDKRWIYNTTKDWISQLLVISERTFQRITADLKKRGIILIKNLHAHKNNRTNYYTIDYQKLEELTGIKTKIFSYEKFKNIISTENSSHKTTNQYRQICQSPPQNHMLSDKKANLELVKVAESNTNRTYTSNNLSLSEKKHSFSYAFEKQTDVKQAQESFEKNKIDLILENEKKPPLAKTLVSIWNETIENGKEIVQLTKTRVQFLLAAFRDKFESSLEKWKDFCQKIATSRFLMGEITSFKAHFDWVLRYSNMQKILEGNYKTGDRELYHEDIIQDKPFEINPSENQFIQNLRNLIHKVFGQSLYESWFSHVHLEERGEKVVFKCPSAFHRDYVQSHYFNTLERILKRDQMIFE